MHQRDPKSCVRSFAEGLRLLSSALEEVGHGLHSVWACNLAQKPGMLLLHSCFEVRVLGLANEALT